LLDQIFTGIESALAQIPFIPHFVQRALVDCLKVIPFLYFIYLAVEFIERQILKNIHSFVNLTKSTRGLFGTIFAFLPECGAQVLASIMYSRRIFTKGMLIAFFVACTDEALPLLFFNGASKAGYIIPVMFMNLFVAAIVCIAVDITSNALGKSDNLTNDDFSMNMPVNTKGCCSHSMLSDAEPPKWYLHPLTHTFNILVFSFVFVAFFYWMIDRMGSVEGVAQFLLINTSWQVLAVAAIGTVSNCFASVFIAIAFALGIIGFPAFAAGMIAVTGIGIKTLEHQDKKSKSPKNISTILFIVAVIVGLMLQLGVRG